jgi:ribosomal protein S18 acetylase RimI-like enzyme
MICISDNIKLQDIKIKDQPKLIALLELIYPPAYKHLWINEDCSFYFNKFYSLDQLKLELSDPNAVYSFVIYNSNVVGIFRFIYDKPFENFPDQKATYLNRIYLSEAAQGKGVAQTLFSWLETRIKQRGNTIIWLKAMDSQRQALRFYEKQGYSFASTTHLDFELIRSHLRGMNTLYKHIN